MAQADDLASASSTAVVVTKSDKSSGAKIVDAPKPLAERVQTTPSNLTEIRAENQLPYIKGARTCPYSATK